MPSVEMMFNLKALVRYDDEAFVFISHCPALGLYSQGETQTEAHDAIKSAVMLYIEAACELQRLDETLSKAGFHPGPEQPETDEFIAVRSDDAVQEIEISVPVTLLTAASQCLQ